MGGTLHKKGTGGYVHRLAGEGVANEALCID